MELARVLPADLNKQVWLVFFDSEDNGRLPGWDWILGSRAFVEALQGTPDSVVIVDMIGDADLNIYKEKNSNAELTEEIWAIAAQHGYAKQFIAEYRHSMLDDHTPFLEHDIRAIDIIDFDYPYWHTSQDTVDKVSAESLEAVGETLRQWLLESE
jgi:Zn-dependent M28 family amino/carboxypeptidase